MKLNQEQKKLILAEIRTWKESRLLPAEYCDFLQNLYAEGDSFPRDEQAQAAGTTGQKRTSGSREGRERSFISQQVQRILVLSGILLLFLIFVFNFTLFPMPMQIAVLVVGTLLPYLLAWRAGDGNPLARLGWLCGAALFLAVDGYYLLMQSGQLQSRTAFLGVMTLVFLGWLLLGSFGKSRLIASLGLGGLLLAFATVLEEAWQVGRSPYGVQHLYWLLPSFGCLLLAYLLGKWRVYVAPVFLFIGLVALLGPELRMLALREPMELFVQGIAFLKVAVLVSLGVVYRLPLKQWMAERSV